MTLLRRLVGADDPQETRVFLVIAAFGLAIGLIYWFVSYEVAGTVLLLAFGAANGLLALRLAIDPAAAVVRGRARRSAVAEADGPGGPDLDRQDVPGGGTGGIDRPFLDESGRLPSETLAPFAMGLGTALAATGPIFGLAPVVVGLLPVAWGAWTWLAGARAELDAVEAEAESEAVERNAAPATVGGADEVAAAGTTRGRARTRR